MKQHLFLKGNSGIGKTTLLRELLTPYFGEIGGFLTQRLLDESGETAGFRLVSLDGERWPESVGRYEPGIEHLFIQRTMDGWKKYPQVFESYGVKLLTQGRGKKLCYLDEIGGIEMKSEAFMNALYGLLEQDVCCIGVLKNERNLSSMGTRVPITEDSASRRDRLEQELTETCGAVVIPYLEQETEAIRSQVEMWISEAFKEHEDG